MPFRRRQPPVEFPELRERLTKVAAADFDKGIVPEWMARVLDIVLLWALNEKTIISAPWYLALLQAEKARRDLRRQALVPALVGGVCALAGGIVGALATLLAARWSNGGH